MGPGMEEAGGWVDGGTGAAAPGVRAGGKQGGGAAELREKEQRESPRFPFPNFYRGFAGRGSGTPKPLILSPSDPAVCRCGGEDADRLGISAALELIPQSQAACHAFLVCFVCFCFNRTNGIIFSRAHVLHETFQNSPRRSQRSLRGGCLEGEGGNQEVSLLFKSCATVM